MGPRSMPVPPPYVELSWISTPSWPELPVGRAELRSARGRVQQAADVGAFLAERCAGQTGKCGQGDRAEIGLHGHLQFAEGLLVVVRGPRRPAMTCPRARRSCTRNCPFRPRK